MIMVALIQMPYPVPATLPRALVRRNRLITALSRATIVIEAGATSGALYAAKCANAQGRAVFVLDNSEGNAALLANFAYPLPDQPGDVDRLIEQIEQHERHERHERQ